MGARTWRRWSTSAAEPDLAGKHPGSGTGSGTAAVAAEADHKQNPGSLDVGCTPRQASTAAAAPSLRSPETVAVVAERANRASSSGVRIANEGGGGDVGGWVSYLQRHYQLDWSWWRQPCGGTDQETSWLRS